MFSSKEKEPKRKNVVNSQLKQTNNKTRNSDCLEIRTTQKRSRSTQEFSPLRRKTLCRTLAELFPISSNTKTFKLRQTDKRPKRLQHKSFLRYRRKTLCRTFAELFPISAITRTSFFRKKTPATPLVKETHQYALLASYLINIMNV